jgi:hypothetical protein
MRKMYIEQKISSPGTPFEMAEKRVAKIGKRIVLNGRQ